MPIEVFSVQGIIFEASATLSAVERNEFSSDQYKSKFCLGRADWVKPHVDFQVKLSTFEHRVKQLLANKPNVQEMTTTVSNFD